MRSIKEIINVDAFCLTLKFNTDDIRLVDLTENIYEWGKNPESKLGELKDPLQFNKVKLDKEFETIARENGIDLCPDVPYHMSIKIKDNTVIQ